MAVNLSPVGGVAGQFFDNNGDPLSGGKIFTYAAGTTTNQATYTSAAGVTAHSNPIILDAAGRVPGGEIWLTDGLQYKFLIKTSTDHLIGSYDNIIGINSNFINFLTETEIQTATAGQTVFTLTTMQYQPGTNSLSVFVDGVNQYDGVTYAYVETSSTVVTFTAGLHVGALVKFTTAQTLSTGVTDASLVTYDPPFTGSVPTNVEVKLSEYVSVKDFGAVGDGVADDTAAIQAAFASIGGFGGRIYLPAGRYKISAQLNVPANTTVYGDGGIAEESATTIYATHNGKVLNCLNDGFVIENLGVEGPDNAAYTNSIGIYTATVASAPFGAANFTIKDVYVIKCYDNININASYNGILSNVISQFAQNIGILALSAQGQWNQVSTLFNKSDGLVLNNYAGTNFNSGNASPTIVNFQTFNNGGAGIVVKGAYTGFDSTPQVSTQGLSLNTFFINNDALGGIVFEDHATANQVFCGTISNGQIQFCGESSWPTRSNAASGISIGENVGKTAIVNVNFFSNAANHIKHDGLGVEVLACNFAGAAQGVPANSLGAVNAYVAPPTPFNENNNSLFGIANQVIMSNSSSNDPLHLQGSYNRISNCWFATNYAALNDGGTATQQTPVITLATTSLENYLTGVAMFQNNTGSSVSAVSFFGDTSSTYSLVNCQVYNANGATAVSNGIQITTYTG